MLLKQELESRTKRADLEWGWKEVICGLDFLRQVEPNFQRRRFLVSLRHMVRKRRVADIERQMHGGSAAKATMER